MTEAMIRSVKPVAADTIAVTLEIPEGFDGRPGQFVLVRATIDGETHSSHYTISSPAVSEQFEITVGVDEETGTLGPWLQSAGPSDSVDIEGPFGETYYENEDPVAILAQGPGIGPAVAIGEQARQASAAVTIVYENDTVPHADRLDSLRTDGCRISLCHDRQEYLETVRDAVPAGQAFVFGFSDFVGDTRDLLSRHEAVDPPKIEDFGPA